jgi:hypothetical protein
MTKYGLRRVRVDLPTLEEALYAAEGLTRDARQQIHIAASLMHLPVDQVQAEAEGIIKCRTGRTHAARDRRPIGAVIVERKSPARRQRLANRLG